MVPTLPRNSVRTAIRLPLKQQTNEKSIVLVEMDTEENENLILKKRNKLRQKNSKNQSKIENKAGPAPNNVASTKPAYLEATINDKFFYQKFANLGIAKTWHYSEQEIVEIIEKGYF